MQRWSGRIHIAGPSSPSTSTPTATLPPLLPPGMSPTGGSAPTFSSTGRGIWRICQRRSLTSSLTTHPSSIGFDPWTTEALADLLRSRGLPVEAVTGRAWVSACQTLLELLQTDRLRHPNRDTLDHQLTFAGRRESTEGRWWITRGNEPVPAVTATARAVYLAARPRPIYAIH